MATCKKCIHSKKCFNNGKTRYYGETIACDNVETLCEWFISTDDVVEVRRGEWSVAIGYDPARKVMCDLCRRMNYEPTNFCPNCGADMRGKKDEKTL